MVGNFKEGTYGGNSVTYSHPSKLVVNYSRLKMGSQCGIYILHGFSLYKDKSSVFTVTQTMADDFVEDLKFYYKKADNRVGKVLISAVHGQKLHELCKKNAEWQFGTTVKNPNSGNKITTFELDIYKGEET